MWKERWIMFDRVVAALVAVMLLLLSASAALASGECHYDTAQCLASLELQAEEVLCTDLEVVSSLDLSETYQVEVEPCATDYVMVLPTNRQIEETYSASGAAGVKATAASCDNRQYESNRHPAIDGANIRSGRFSGATA
jgi:hypothetical protein